MLNAWTLEVDDPDVAVAEILEQLDLENQLQTYSAGFITCSYDYLETGMLEAVCKALPFEIVGCTTLANSVNEKAGTLLFCLSVLTADDCRFATASTPPLSGDIRATINKTFHEAAAKLDGPPKLMLAFLPIIGPIGGELMLNALDEAASGAPIFGITTSDADTAYFSNSYTFHKNEVFRDCVTFLMISGNINPHFVVTSTSEQNIQKQKHLITASKGSVLKELNGINTREYLSSLGLLYGEGIEALSSVPFVVNYNDGSQPVARVVYSLDDEGAAICGGAMPEGGTVSIGRMDVEDILLTAKNSVEKILQNKGLNCIIMLPCLGRNMVLGFNPLAEIETVRDVIGDSLPWHLAYSGGEVCPVYCNTGGTINRFHNFTFIACAI